MDSETDGADECQPTTSNTNVRNKVSSWVTKFVSEMRTKSPVVVQRWVDSIPNDKVTHATDESENFRVTAVSNDTVSKANRESTIELIVSDKELNELNVQSEGDCSAGEREPHRQDEKTHASTNDLETHTTDRRFWNKGPSLLNSLRIRSSTDLLRATETEDLNTTSQLPQSDTPDKIHASTPLSNKSNLNDLYYRLSINKKRYTFIKERKMEAKQLLNNAKSRFLAAANWDDLKDRDTSAPSDDQIESENAAATAVIVNDANDSSGVASVVCDMIDMDLSADEFSRLSQSNDMLSVDDEDSFNVSMPSINDGHTSHLNVSRKIAMADIGRSTSDNPRLRNKFYLADIGRSFSEHQDDEAIIIGERNISAPSSSIAIQNNNRSNGHFFERRAYSVSPTQRGMKRGVLSRDHSLSDGSRHRNQLSKGSSFQSDSSHCSSVESLLDARKPDSEAILRQLGFGPAHQEDLLSRIPKRFLKPSQVHGIDTEAFMRQQQIATNLHEQSILGYRGLTGNPHVLPSEIVGKIMERFQRSVEKSNKMYDLFNDGRPMSAPPTPGPTDLTDVRHPEP